MNNATKLGLGAIAAAVLLFLTPLGSMLVDLVAGEPSGEQASAPGPARPVAPPPGPTEDLASSTAPPQQRTAAATPDPPSHHMEPEPEDPAPEPVTGVRMRFVDDSGAPVGGVTVALERNEDTGGVSDGSGVAEAWLDPRGRVWGNRWSVIYEHPSFARGELKVALETDALKELGDVVLVPAGSITVRVEDSGGAPVEGAWVEPFSDFQMRYRTRDLEEERIELSLPGRISSPVTDASGRLRLESLPEGRLRVWAGREGHLAGYSELVEVEPGVLAEDVVVSLGVLDPELFFRGQVLDPSGAGVPRAMIRAEYSSGGGSGSTTFSADEEGRFILAYAPKAPRIIRATDPKERYGSASAEGVVGGDDVVLQLTEPDFMRVAVSSEQEGAELAGLRAMVYDSEHSELLLYGTQIKQEGAVLRFALPDEAFLLEVQADGHERLSLGPFEGRAAPRELDVTLGRVAGVTGRVTAGGEPVEGAKVQVYGRQPRRTLHNGFPVRVIGHPWASGRSGPEGAFDLTLRQEAEIYLRVEAEGFAPAEQGPWAFDPELGLAGLAVELSGGGSIEGMVFGADQAAGRIVAISRGDAHARTTRTDAEGAYRFERLIPGPWQVELVEEEISPNSSSSSTRSGAFRESDIESNCVVVEGQTTRHDISLTGEGQVLLAGRLELDGGGGAGWEARIMPADRDALLPRGGAREDTLGSDGGFRLEVPEPGEYWLSLRPPQGGIFMLVERVLLVPGENAWEGSFVTGGVSFTNAPPAEAGLPTLVLVGSNGKTQFMMAVGGSLGLTASEGVPVMPAELRRIDPDALSGFEDLERAGTVLVDVQLRAGETVEVIVP